MTGHTGVAPVHVPCATYRIQLNRGFRFSDVSAIVDYLDDLGISDCYLSPFLAARPGSLHGYDVIDHSRLNPEIGCEEDLSALVERLRQRGMGIIADVVPNHMCVDPVGNPLWADVLENGPSSPYASFFDIDWNPPKEELVGKVLLPMLGDQYGRALENGVIQVVQENGAFLAAFYENRLPLGPRSWPIILEPVAARLRESLGAGHYHTLELESILTAISHLPDRTVTDEERVRERQREKEIIKRRVAALLESSPPAADALKAEIAAINGVPGDPASFDRLERMLADQAWRLAFWRVAADEINYRRFFDINELAAIRVEDPVVFQAVHQLILDYIGRGWIRGLRVDHPDGLFDPAGYFSALQAACRDALGGGQQQPFFIVAEKIVTGDEQLRPHWPIEGTTGYGFMNFLNGLFVDSSHSGAFHRLTASFTGLTVNYADLLYHARKLILEVSMSSELNVLARRLDHISEQHRYSRDFTLESLRDALREVVTCFPVYRTYVTPDSPWPEAEDERHIRHAIAQAKRRNPSVSESVFDFIQSVLLLQHPDGLDETQIAERRLFVYRLQQFTGPVIAKGVEDTAFYRWHPLASLNEVGGELEAFGFSPQFFHAKNFVRRAMWPNALAPTSTHDSKRGEDVRARINALSEIPGEWLQAIRRWHALNQPMRSDIGGHPAPSVNEEYLLYQTLIGAWPAGMCLSPEPARPVPPPPEFIERVREYMTKALREAKIHSSWISPNAAWEGAVSSFIDGILAPRSAFLEAFAPFQQSIARVGVLNSLSQLVLKAASPGVPDFYQGSELWNLSLVDPDNRRPVDYSLHRSILERTLESTRRQPRHRAAAALLADPADGAIKLYLTRAALRLRRAARDLFAEGSYLPLRPAGARQRHVVAFARQHGAQSVIAAAGRFYLSLGAGKGRPLDSSVWGDSTLLLRKELGAGPWVDLFTGREVRAESAGGKPRIPLSDLFATLPVALLVSAGLDYER